MRPFPLPFCFCISLCAATLSPGVTDARAPSIDGKPPLVIPEVKNGLRVSLLAKLQAHKAEGYGLRFSSDGALLATGGEDGSVRVWSTRGFHPRHALALSGGGICDLAFVGASHTLRVLRETRPHAGTPSDDSSGEFATPREVEVVAWNADSGRKLRSWRVPGTALGGYSWSGDGKWLAIVRARSEPSAPVTAAMATIYDASTGRERSSFTLFSGDYDLALARDGSWVIASTRGLPMLRFRVGSSEPQKWGPGHDYLYLSPDGRQLAGLDETPQVTTYEAATGRVKRTWQAPGTFWSAGFSPDGKLLAVGQGGLESRGVFQVWDVASASPRSLLNLTEHKAGVFQIQFSPDGRLLATSDASGTLRVWRLRPPPGRRPGSRAAARLRVRRSGRSR